MHPFDRYLFTRTVSTKAFRHRKLSYYKLNTRTYTTMWILHYAAAGLIL